MHEARWEHDVSRGLPRPRHPSDVRTGLKSRAIRSKSFQDWAHGRAPLLRWAVGDDGRGHQGPEAEGGLVERWGAPTGGCGWEAWTARATTPGARVSGESTPAIDEALPRSCARSLGVPLTGYHIEHMF